MTREQINQAQKALATLDAAASEAPASRRSHVQISLASQTLSAIFLEEKRRLDAELEAKLKVQGSLNDAVIAKK